jgi:flagellar motor component MotA
MIAENIKNTLDDLKWIITFITTCIGFLTTNIHFVLQYQLHIIMIVLLCSLCTYSILIKRMKIVESQNLELFKEQEKQRLKATVSTVFNEFKDIEVIDFESSAKYIYELEELRKKLGVNSFTQSKLSILLKKINLG